MSEPTPLSDAEKQIEYRHAYAMWRLWADRAKAAEAQVAAVQDALDWQDARQRPTIAVARVREALAVAGTSGIPPETTARLDVVTPGTAEIVAQATSPDAPPADVPAPAPEEDAPHDPTTVEPANPTETDDDPDTLAGDPDDDPAADPFTEED